MIQGTDTIQYTHRYRDIISLILVI